MADVVVKGDTSGAVTLSAPAVAGTVTVTLPSTSGTMAVLPTATGVLAESAGGTGTTTGYYGFKNRIINGAMVIDQRNAGGVVTVTGAYPVDRFAIRLSTAGKFTAQQNAGSITPPVGFKNYLGTTSSSAYPVVSSDWFAIQQVIEGYNIADLGWGTASAATVTLSFWVRSSLTGTFGGSISDGSAYSYPFTYSIPTANTWTQISVTITGPTSGTWSSTNGVGCFVLFGLGAGTTLSGTAGAWASAFYASATGATSVVGTNGATFYITGVQFEKGSTATSFDYRPYGTELQLCQRYFQKFPGVLLSGYAGISSSYYNNYLFPVELRTAPTILYSNFSNNNSGNASTNSVTTKVWRVTALMSSLGVGYSVFDAETSGAEL